MKITRYKDLRMQNKMFLGFLAVILIIAVLMGYFSMSVSENSIKTQMLDSVQETTRQMGENIDNEIQKVLNISTQVCSDERIRSILQEGSPDSLRQYFENDMVIKRILDESFSTVFSVENVFVCSYNGRIYTADKNKLSLETNYDFTRTGWFEEMKNSNQNTKIMSGYDVNSYLSMGETQKLFSVVKMIYDRTQTKEIGCIIIDMNSNILGNVLQKINSNSYQQALIIDNDKKIIYHPDSYYIGTQYRERKVSEMLTKKNGSIESEDGEGYLVFSTSDITGWSVLSIIENRYIMEGVNRLRLFLVIITGFCLVLSIMIARTISKTISGPILRLKEQMHQVEEGDFDISAEAAAKDEIGHLTLAFNEMVRRTKKLIENVYQSEIYQKEAELNALQAQINPHFLYNTLQIIDMMAEGDSRNYSISL